MTTLCTGVEIGTAFQRKLICYHHIDFLKSSVLKGQFAEEPFTATSAWFPKTHFFQTVFEILQKKAEAGAWQRHTHFRCRFMLCFTYFFQAAWTVFWMKDFSIPSVRASGRGYTYDLQVDSFFIDEPSTFPYRLMPVFIKEKITL